LKANSTQNWRKAVYNFMDRERERERERALVSGNNGNATIAFLKLLQIYTYTVI
jgi:hypothetical protein